MSHPDFHHVTEPVGGITHSYELSPDGGHIVCHNGYHGGDIDSTFGLRPVIYAVFGAAIGRYGDAVEVDGYTLHVRDTHGSWHRCDYNTEPKQDVIFDATPEADYDEMFDAYFPGHTFNDAGEP